MTDRARPISDALAADLWVDTPEPVAEPIAPITRQRVTQEAIVAASPLLRSRWDQDNEQVDGVAEAQPEAQTEDSEDEDRPTSVTVRSSGTRATASTSISTTAHGGTSRARSSRTEAAEGLEDNDDEDDVGAPAPLEGGADDLDTPGLMELPPPARSVPTAQERRRRSRSRGRSGDLVVAPMKTHLPQAPEAATDLLRDPVPPVVPVLGASPGPASARRHRGRGLRWSLFALVMLPLCAGLAAVVLGQPGSSAGGTPEAAEQRPHRTAPPPR